VALVHVIQIQGDDTWFQVYIDAHSGQVVSSTNFRSDFEQPGVSILIIQFYKILMAGSYHLQYAAVPIEKQKIEEVPFETFIVNPADNISSPRGWHDNGQTVSRDTSCVSSFVPDLPHLTYVDRGFQRKQYHRVH